MTRRKRLIIALLVAVISSASLLPALAKPTPLGHTVPGETVRQNAGNPNDEPEQAIALQVAPENLYHYLVEYEHFIDPDPELPPGGAGVWRCPYGDCLGRIDMRTNVQAETPGPADDNGFMWAVYDVQKPDICTQGNCDFQGLELGIGPDAEVPPGRINTLENTYDITINETQTLAILIELLTLHGDPTGVNRWKPLLSDHIILGAEVYLIADFLSPVAMLGAWDLQRAVIQGNYRHRRETTTNGEHLQYLALKGAQYGVNPLAFIPPDLPYEGLGVPATTITESFDTADSDTLGPDLAWAEIELDTDIISNRSDFTQATADQTTARAESSLSDDDMYAQGVVTLSGNNYGAGVAVRFSDDAEPNEDYYLFTGRDRTSTGCKIHKNVNGTFTEIASASGQINSGETIRLDISGSSLTTLVEGSAGNCSATDSSITGEFKAGIGAFQNRAGSNGIDDFEASDGVVAVTKTDTQVIVNFVHYTKEPPQ